METTAAPRKRKRGPVKRGWEHTHLLLPPHLIDWAKEYPEGMGALVRLLLQTEYERQVDALETQESKRYR